LGNLVPLSETQNKSVKNQPWPEKRKRFKGLKFPDDTRDREVKNLVYRGDQEATKNLIAWTIETWPELSAI
jgi:hypothetical protein